MDNQICNKCKINKPIDDFYFRKNREVYYKHCKICHYEITNAYRKNNPDRFKKNNNSPASRAAQKRWNVRNPDKIKAQSQRRSLKRNPNYKPRSETPYVRNRQAERLRKFGFTQNQYDEMVINQNGCCAICHKQRALVMDHDHSCCPRGCSNCFRGLICAGCNREIAIFDAPQRFVSAQRYLGLIPETIFNVTNHNIVGGGSNGQMRMCDSSNL